MNFRRNTPENTEQVMPTVPVRLGAHQWEMPEDAANYLVATPERQKVGSRALGRLATHFGSPENVGLEQIYQAIGMHPIEQERVPVVEARDLTVFC